MHEYKFAQKSTSSDVTFTSSTIFAARIFARTQITRTRSTKKLSTAFKCKRFFREPITRRNSRETAM